MWNDFKLQVYVLGWPTLLGLDSLSQIGIWSVTQIIRTLNVIVS